MRFAASDHCASTRREFRSANLLRSRHCQKPILQVDSVYNADLVVEKIVIIELKCCEHLLREHQAQVINYLTVAQLPVGLLVNFRHRKLQYKRLHHQEAVNFEETEEEKVPF